MFEAQRLCVISKAAAIATANVLIKRHLELNLRVRLNVTGMKSHPGMKKILLTREFHLGMKRVAFHPGMKFNLKENL